MIPERLDHGFWALKIHFRVERRELTSDESLQWPCIDIIMQCHSIDVLPIR